MHGRLTRRCAHLRDSRNLVAAPRGASGERHDKGMNLPPLWRRAPAAVPSPRKERADRVIATIGLMRTLSCPFRGVTGRDVSDDYYSESQADESQPIKPPLGGPQSWSRVREGSQRVRLRPLLGKRCGRRSSRNSNNGVRVDLHPKYSTGRDPYYALGILQTQFFRN